VSPRANPEKKDCDPLPDATESPAEDMEVWWSEKSNMDILMSKFVIVELFFAG
jgi:hypothetical protein